MPDGTEQIIDVLCVMDAETIIDTLAKSTDAGTPTQVTDPNLIHMVVKAGDVVSGGGGSELNIKAKTLDVIRWRSTSMSLNAAYDTLLYKFVTTGGGDLISPPVPLIVESQVPLPNPSDPTKPESQTIQNYFWNSTVEKTGTVTYHFNFAIYGRDVSLVGYYWWDPYITISD